jgi:hypothetical protein
METKEDYIEGTEAFRQRGLRLRAEVERNVKKDVMELATMVYSEVLNNYRGVEYNQIQAMKVFSALIAKFVKSNDRLGNRMLGLTIALTVLTALMLYKMICP